MQREVPFKMVVDAAYVGNANRNSSSSVQLNNVPYGTTRIDLNPQNADPSQNNTQALPLDYLRPYRGLGSISQQAWKGYANYHSFQLSVTRRMANSFSYSLAYTASTRSSRGTFDPFLSEAQNVERSYTKNGSRPHVLTLYYDYQVPGLSKLIDNPVVAAVGDGWQFSGVTSYLSGTRGGFSYSFTGAPFSDMTGGGLGGPRVALVCDPTLPEKEQTFDRQFKTECIQPGGPTTVPGDVYFLGNAKNDEWISRGYVNHDFTLFKNFRIAGQRNLQVRVEMYNAFNLTQLTGVGTTAQFNYATGAQTNASFGRITSARSNSARVIQLAGRFTF